MVSVAEYRRIVAEHMANLRRVETVPLLDCLTCTRLAAATVRSEVPVPGFANSQMDGFAVRAADLAPALPLAPMIAAGAEAPALPAGHAAPIMTGARLPEGADAVVPVEETLTGFTDATSVTLAEAALASTTPGRFVRGIGTDIAPGDVLVREGDVLTPARLGVLASCGVTELEVYAPVRVLVVTTGDEVVPVGTPVTGHHSALVHDANGPAMSATLAAAGAHVVDLVHVRDEPAALHEALALRAGAIDLVVSMGGISMGQREVVKLAAEADPDSRMEFTKVAMQPGGPQGIGTLAGVPWIGLPGNPVSGLVSAEMFLRPALLGLDPEAPARPQSRAVLRTSTPEGSPAGKLQVRRARVAQAVQAGAAQADGASTADGSAGTAVPEVTLVSGPSSHLLRAYAESNAFVLVPEDVTELRDGDEVTVWHLG